MSDLTAEFIRLGAKNERLREELDKTQRFYIEAGFELRQLREDNKRLEAEKAVWQGVEKLGEEWQQKILFMIDDNERVIGAFKAQGVSCLQIFHRRGNK